MSVARPKRKSDNTEGPRFYLFYWIADAEEGRPGGVWWIKSHSNKEELDHWLAKMKPYLKAYAFVQKNEQMPEWEHNQARGVSPPRLDQIVFLNGTGSCCLG